MHDASGKTLKSRIVRRATARKLLVAAASSGILAAGGAAFAPAASATEPAGTVVQAGGMVRAASAASAAAQAVAPAASYPSCGAIRYVGNAGYISVQERSGRLQWGITMTPLSYSIGKWSVSTYLSGKKTTSGFNRTVTVGYIPHGSLAVPSGKIFHVQAQVVGPNGTFVNVPNACRT